MKACTSVVTKIAYHKGKSFEADITFLSEAEWRSEVAILLKDILDEEERPILATDLNSEAGIALAKVIGFYSLFLGTC
jgi:hypothetical protein